MAPTPAARDPIARVVVDVPLAHLDRPFDYLVPAELADSVVAGGRVRVRFASKLVNAYVLERAADTEFTGTLVPVERAVSAEPVLTPEIARLAREVADRYAGSMADVLRLAIPPRHARVENATVAPSPPAEPPDAGDPTGWDRYQAGSAWLRAVRDGRPARAVWAALPGEDWPARVAEAVRAALAGGRGALVVVPDRRDLTRVEVALAAVLGSDAQVALAADLGPAERYRRWLAVRRGRVRAVAGTRAAGFAPVTDLGLIVVWDDGDDAHTERRAPYPHTRDLAVLRAHLLGAALLVAGFARTAEAQSLLETGWAHPIGATRAEVRAAAPRVVPVGDDDQLARDPAARTARLPSVAWRAAHDALAAAAPVLVQVPRSGYVPSLACARCRRPARCAHCQGALAATAGGARPTCRWCGRPAADWRCPSCGSVRLRALVVGAGRTAEELGRAFPGVPVRSSGGDHVLDTVPPGRSLVVATPGAEPVVDGGYGAALLLDGWVSLSRPELRGTEEALRRWMNAAALVRPAAAGGRVVVGADGGSPTVAALLRWDAAGHAGRELAERAELGFPPATRMASVTGPPGALADLLELARLPASAQVLGPVPVDEEAERVVVRTARADGLALARALRAAVAVRTARKAADPVTVLMDPREPL